MRDVARALHYAHGQGLIHRDVKSRNIMLDRKGVVKLMDFGLARSMEGDFTQLTVSGDILGSPAYMSPEQAAGLLHELDARTDVYSLGVVLYELIAGRLPFASPQIQQVLRAIQSGQFKPPSDYRPDIPAPVQELCLKAMRRAPDERFQNSEALALEIDALV